MNEMTMLIRSTGLFRSGGGFSFCDSLVPNAPMRRRYFPHHNSDPFTRNLQSFFCRHSECSDQAADLRWRPPL